MSIPEICRELQMEYPDLFTEKEIKVAWDKFTKILQNDIRKGKVKEYDNFGTTVLTEYGITTSKAKMKKCIAQKDKWGRKWKRKPNKFNWFKQRIDMYFKFC